MMNKQDILRKIGNIINELNEQHQYLSNTSKINILELELFTANADFLIDHIEILKKINNHVSEIAAHDTSASEDIITPQISIPEKEEIPVISTIVEAKSEDVFYENIKQEEEIPQNEEGKSAPLFKFDFEEPTEMVFDFEKKVAVQDVFDRALTVEEQNLIEDKKKALVEEEIVARNNVQENIEEVEEEEIGEEPFIIQKAEVILEQPTVQEVKIEQENPVVQKNKVVDVIAEPEQQKSDKVPSLNDVLSGKLQQNNTSSSSLKPISDLKASISLNDKMFFIKELFNGYNLAYSEAIEILNRFDSFEAADNFLMKNYAEKNTWSAKQNTVDRLYEILNRKFKS